MIAEFKHAPVQVLAHTVSLVDFISYDYFYTSLGNSHIVMGCINAILISKEHGDLLNRYLPFTPPRVILVFSSIVYGHLQNSRYLPFTPHQLILVFLSIVYVHLSNIRSLPFKAAISDVQPHSTHRVYNTIFHMKTVWVSPLEELNLFNRQVLLQLWQFLPAIGHWSFQ